MDTVSSFQLLGVSAALGMLVGLQRQRAQSHVGGVRTFPLITCLGTFGALLAQHFGGWFLALGLVVLGGMLALGNARRRDPEGGTGGTTTEITALLMYAIGAYLVIGHVAVAVVTTGGIVILLHLKRPMHDFVKRMGGDDLTAIMQFVLITLVILPILPDRAYGPYAVLNPHDIWLMVVLIVGIGLGGYVVYKLFGARAGVLLSGVLGGVISSTATTVSYARRVRSAPESAALAAAVVVIASTVSFGRVLVEIVAVAPHSLRLMAPPLLAMAGVMTVLSAVVFMVGRKGDGGLPSQGNPAELRSAVVFGLLYGVILFVVAATRERYGTGVLYVVGAISGLTDMDAITLSTARLVERGQLEADAGWRVILIAALSNLVFKGGIAAVLGGWWLGRRVLALFAIAMVAGVLILALWPGQDAVDEPGAGPAVSAPAVSAPPAAAAPAAPAAPAPASPAP